MIPKVHKSCTLEVIINNINNLSSILKESSIQIKELQQLLKKQDQNFSPIKEVIQQLSQAEKNFDEISKIS